MISRPAVNNLFTVLDLLGISSAHMMHLGTHVRGLVKRRGRRTELTSGDTGWTPRLRTYQYSRCAAHPSYLSLLLGRRKEFLQGCSASDTSALRQPHADRRSHQCTARHTLAGRGYHRRYCSIHRNCTLHPVEISIRLSRARICKCQRQLL